MVTPAPMEAFQRRAELQLAALLVALVVIPDALARVQGEQDGSGTARREPPAGRPRRTAKGRHVRPPRSC